MLTFRCTEAWNEYKKKKVMMSDQRAVILKLYILRNWLLQTVPVKMHKLENFEMCNYWL